MATLQGNTTQNRIDWGTTFVMVVFHVFAVVALFHFSWKPFLYALVLWWISGSLGIGLGPPAHASRVQGAAMAGVLPHRLRHAGA